MRPGLGRSRSVPGWCRDGKAIGAALIVGVATLGIILAFRRWWSKVPGILIAVVGAALATSVFDLAARGVPVVGPIPAGFPTPTLPDVGFHDLATLFVAAAGMAFVTLADTTAVSRSIAARRGEHVDADQEIVALGAANAAAGFFQGFPVSASATRTAVAESAGSGTQAAGVVGALAMIAILLTGAGIGQYLPEASLAAIVIAAALLLLDVSTLRWFWRARRSEFYLSIAALLGVAVLGVLAGHCCRGPVVAERLRTASVAAVRRRARTRRGRKGYHDIERHPDAVQIPGLVLYRFDAPLFFANAELFADRLTAAIRARNDMTRWVIVAAEPMTDVDSTAAEILGRLIDELEHEGVELRCRAEGSGQGPAPQLRALRPHRRRPFLPDPRHRDPRLPRGDGHRVGRLERRRGRRFDQTGAVTKPAATQRLR